MALLRGKSIVGDMPWAISFGYPFFDIQWQHWRDDDSTERKWPPRVLFSRGVVEGQKLPLIK